MAGSRPRGDRCRVDLFGRRKKGAPFIVVPPGWVKHQRGTSCAGRLVQQKQEVSAPANSIIKKYH
jgi:hypothetical protein